MRARSLFVVAAAALAAAAPVTGLADTPTIDAPASVATPASRLDPPRSLSVAAVGDFLSEGLVNQAAASAAPPGVRYDYEPLLRPSAAYIAAADLAICQMETPIGWPGAKVGYVGEGPGGVNRIAAAWESAGDLRRVGFDRCSTASNHAYDLGVDGISSTLTALDAVGLGHSGTARTVTEADAATAPFTVNHVRVSHLAYTQTSNTGWPAEAWRISHTTDAGPIVRDVAAARAKGADLVIVSLHVIAELGSTPTAFDRAMVTAVVDGAHPDLVIVHGPHTVQPLERVHGTLVYWSVGNYLSAMGIPSRTRFSDPRTLDELLAWVRFVEQPNGTWSATPWTILLCNVPGEWRVYPALTTLQSPSITSTLRTALTSCVVRSSVVVADLH